MVKMEMPYNSRKKFLQLICVVNEWNKLPQKIVKPPSINAFKNMLDTDWKDTGV